MLLYFLHLLIHPFFLPSPSWLPLILVGFTQLQLVRSLLPPVCRVLVSLRQVGLACRSDITIVALAFFLR